MKDNIPEVEDIVVFNEECLNEIAAGMGEDKVKTRRNLGLFQVTASTPASFSPHGYIVKIMSLGNEGYEIDTCIYTDGVPFAGRPATDKPFFKLAGTEQTVSVP